MTDFVVSNDLVVLGGFDLSGSSGSGSILATNASGFAVLDETSSASNPTLIPRRADLTTGLGGSDGEGTPFLHLITDGVQRMIMSAASTVFTVTDRVQVNGRIMIFGNANQTQLFIRGHSTQTGTIVLIENNAQDSLLEINDLGTITLGDDLAAAIDVLHLSHPSNPGPAGTLIDSHALLWTGTSFDGGAHTIDWKTFVEPTANDGTGSIWTLQTRIDAGGYVDQLTIAEGGLLTMPLANSAISLGPNASASGDIRFGNGRFIAWRNMNNNGDLHALSVDEDDFVNIGTANAPRVRILSPSFSVLNPGPYSFGSLTPLTHIQFLVTGAFTSSGASNLTSGGLFASDITGFSGDLSLSQVRMGGVNVGGSITTSGAGDSVFAATLWLDEPDITLTPSDAMALAATLYISGAPTEGTSANYALFIDNGTARFDGAVQMFANSFFVGPANTFTFGSGVAQTHTHVAIIGAFTSSGISNHAERVFIGGSLTGFNADTLSLAGLLVDASITTQGATNVIADVAQLILNEPDITVGTGDTITNASTLSILGAPTEGVSNWALRVASGDVILGGNLTVSGAGPHAIAGAAFGAVQLLIGDTFTSDGSSNIASGLFHTPTIVGAPGDTSALTGTTLTAGITTQTATESISNISQLQINEPFITDNLTGTISSAQSLLITGAPTEGSQNWALKINSGDVRFGGDILNIGTGGGSVDVVLVGCSEFFMSIIPSPEEMVFGVGSTGSLNETTLSVATAAVKFRLRSTTGDFMEVRRVAQSFPLSSGSSVTIALIPAGSFVVGITARVTTAVTGPTGFDIGDGVDVDRWGNSISGSLGTTVDITDFTASELSLFPTTNDIVITSDGVDFTGGAVRVVVHYLSLSAPTI